MGDTDELESRLSELEAKVASLAEPEKPPPDRSGELLKFINDLQDKVEVYRVKAEAAERDLRSMIDRKDPRLDRHQLDIDEIYRRLRRPVEESGGGSGNVQVWRLQKDGGTLNTPGTRSTWTYSLFDKDTSAAIAGGTHIGMTGIGPRWARMPTTYAEWGIGYIGADGRPALIWADETYDYNICLELP